MIKIYGKSSVVLNGGTLIIGSHPSGSILFSGTTTSNILISNDIDFRFRTGDFTVEWWQYQTDNSPFTRPWSQGSWPAATIAVSLEGGLFYYWEGGSLIDQGSIGTYKNVWIHFAVARSGSTIKIFKNGTQLGSNISSSYDYNSTYDLEIGNQTDNLSTAVFGGNITNFRWIKGTALYTSDFQVPSSPLTTTSDTKLLLLASNLVDVHKDSSGLNKNIINSNTTWSSMTPF